MHFPYEHPRWKEVMGSFLHPGGKELSRRLLALCAFPRGARILDLGCGLGATLQLLREQGTDAVGLDRSSKMLEEASRHGPVLSGELQAVPLENASLDGAICECVLSQQPRAFPAVQEMYRILKPQGLLGMTDLFARHEQSFPKTPCTEDTLYSCSEGALFRQDLEELFRKEGFFLRCFEDHSRLLREYAARLVWEELLESPFRDCSCKALGYGLWVWQKKEFPEEILS